MWRDKSRAAPVAEFLGWILFSSLLVDGTLLLLEPHSVAYTATGRMTVGYLIYAVIGLLFSTPAPAIVLFVVLRQHERISLGTYLRRILHTPRPVATVAVTGFFSATALVPALVCGTRLNAPWYLMPLGFLVMIPFVGLAEEPGWRGFLQPALEQRFPFPVATALTAAIWAVWHFPQWLMPSSNHYGDNLIGFVIHIFVWSFALAAIYKVSRSVLACAIYHAFVNSLGAIYDWNALFDAYPKSIPQTVYCAVVFLAAIALWVAANKIERRHIP